MSYLKIVIANILIFYSTLIFSQVSINTDGSSPDNSAMLDVKSNNKGFLLPRMTTTERDQIQQPAEGLMIFNTSDNALNYFSGQVWFTVNSVNLCSPVISTQPVDFAGCAGVNATFTTSANGDGLSYLWQEDQGAGFSDITDGGIYSGANTNSLIISGILLSMNNYTYRCIISGTCPPADTTTVVSLGVYSPVQITDHPYPQQGCEFSTVHFSVGATGDNLSYQWQEDSGNGFVNTYYNGYNTDLLDVDVYSGMDGYLYRCIVTDNCSNADTSGSAGLTVFTIIYINTPPANQTVTAGGNASFSVSVTGDVIGYQWEEDQGNGYAPLSDGGIYSGANTQTLTITGVTSSMNGYQYRCTMYGNCNVETSPGATLTVN